MLKIKDASLSFYIEDKYLINIVEGGQNITSIMASVYKSENMNDLEMTLNALVFDGKPIKYEIYELKRI